MASESNITEERPSKRLRIDFNEDFVLLVGTEEKRFVVHRDMLCANSVFFQAACSEKWRKGKENVIELPAQNPTAVSIYLHWRYLEILDLWDGREERPTKTDPDGTTRPSVSDRYERLIYSYQFGDMIRDDMFCNTLIDSYFDLRWEVRTFPSDHEINLAFRILPETSKLRLLILHHMAFTADASALEKIADKTTPEVWKQVALLSSRERDTPIGEKTAWSRGKTFYYKDDSGKAKQQ